MEQNKSVYALTKISDPEGFCSEIEGISGVLSAAVDMQSMTLEYTIDEWTSEYDVFTAVMGIADAYGVEFDFEDHSLSDQAPEEETTEPESLPVEEEDLDDDDEEEDEQASEDGDVDQKPKKKKKGLSDLVQRIIELAFAAACFIGGLFFEDTVQLIFLSVAFALAGYEVLYRAVVKITKKEIINEELVLSLAFFGAILLGKPTEAVAAMLVYSLAAFALKTGTDVIEARSPVYTMPEKCRRMSGENKAVRVEPKEIVVGDEVFFKKGEHCIFDGIVKTETEVIAYNGKTRTLAVGDEVFAGERFNKNTVVETVKTIGEGAFDKRNARAAAVVGAKSGVCRFVSKRCAVYLPCFLVFCLALAFLPPILCDDYVQGLYRWGYTAVIIAACCSSLLLCGTDALALFAMILPASEKGVMPADYATAQRLALSDEVYIDRESVMLCGDQIKDDCRGAALELRDFGVSPVLATSLSEDEAVEMCSEYKYPAYAANKNDSEKVELFDKALKEGKTVVIGEKTLKKYGLTEEKGTIIVYGDGSDYNASVTVTENRLADLPFALKLAARTVKVCKASFIAQLAVKGALVLLALFGVANLWWAFLADTLVGIVFCVAAVLNKKEVL